MLTSEDILALQHVSFTESGDRKVRPILTSSQFLRQKSLGIEVRAMADIESEAPSEDSGVFTDVPESIVVRDPTDAIAWIQVFNERRVSYCIKVRLNKRVWKYPSFFPGCAFAVVTCRDWLVVALTTGCLYFVDVDAGCARHPFIALDGKVEYLRGDGDMLVCMTEKKVLYVWRLLENNRIECLVKASWIGELPKIEKIELSNELENGSLSPIVVTEEFSVRYSQSQQGWVFYGAEIPAVFEQARLYEVTADCERVFHNSLMHHDGESLKEMFSMLMNCYVRYGVVGRAREMMGEVFERMRDGTRRIGGMNLRALMLCGMEIIRNGNCELAREIEESEEYKAVMEIDEGEFSGPEFSPKQPLSPLVSEHEEIVEPVQEVPEPVVESSPPRPKPKPTRKSNLLTLKEKHEIANIISELALVMRRFEDHFEFTKEQNDALQHIMIEKSAYRATAEKLARKKKPNEQAMREFIENACNEAKSTPATRKARRPRQPRQDVEKFSIVLPLFQPEDIGLEKEEPKE